MKAGRTKSGNSGLRALAMIGSRVAMLLFWIVLAAAVFLQALRQRLQARYVAVPASESEAQCNLSSPEPVRLVLAARRLGLGSVDQGIARG